MKRIYILLIIMLLFFAMMPAKAAYADVAGSMRYNSSAGDMEFYDGSQWHLFATGIIPLGACSKPGSMDYVPLLGSFEICNGSLWIPTAGVITLNACSTAGMLDYRSSTFMMCNGLVWVDLKGALSA